MAVKRTIRKNSSIKNTKLLRVIATVLALIGAAAAHAQTSIGETPRFPNVGSPPAGIPVIDQGSVLLCIGMSQANDECGGERPLHENGWLHQTLLPVVIVNGGIDGFDVRKIMGNPDAWWSEIEQRLQDAGYTNDDVQLIWGKNATRSGLASGGSNDLLIERTELRNSLVRIQQQAEARFPNLRAGFHSSRMFGGFCDLNSEPFAFDTINAIIGWTGEPGAIDAAPLWHLGPYIWADGDVPRADGLTWLESDFVADGCHPSQSGINKFVVQAEIFFNQLTYAPVGGPQPPAAPTDLTATAVDDQGIDLAWTDMSTDEDGFRIERAEGPAGAYADIQFSAANTTAYSDTGLAASTEYCYRVSAVNAAGASGFTAVSCATTAAPPPPPPPPPPITQTSSGGGAMHAGSLLLLLLVAGGRTSARRR